MRMQDADLTRTTLKSGGYINRPSTASSIMAATITLAEKRETEYPGSYQYVVDEMLEANGIPPVRFPDTVVRNFQSQFKNKESRKRQRSQMEDTPIPEEASSQASQESEVPAYVLTSRGSGDWQQKLQLLHQHQYTHLYQHLYKHQHQHQLKHQHRHQLKHQLKHHHRLPSQTPTTSPKRETGAIAKVPR